jgi:integrase-like protein
MTCDSQEEAQFECARMRWLADARGRLAGHTFDDYEARWARRIEPRFGELALADIKPRMIAAWCGRDAGGGCGQGGDPQGHGVAAVDVHGRHRMG